MVTRLRASPSRRRKLDPRPDEALLRLFWLVRHHRGLPRDHLPPAVPFQKRAGVQLVLDLFAAFFLVACADEAERHDRGVAVLLNANVFRRVSGWRLVCLRRLFLRGADVLHDLSLAATSSAGPGVDDLFRPEAVVHRGVVTARAG